jgi:tellurite resistance protein TerC
MSLPLLTSWLIGPALANAPAAAQAAAPDKPWVFLEHFPPVTLGIFATIFVVSLVLDIVQHQDHKEVTVKNAAGWSLFWVALSLGFWGWLKVYHGDGMLGVKLDGAPYKPDWSSLFLTGYVLEKTLSVDNLMVFIAIFRYFGIRSGLQHRILYYGILGAIGFRAVFVGVGAALLEVAGPYAEIGFGLFVLWAAVQMLKSKDDEEEESDYSKEPLVRFAERFYPVFPKLAGVNFFVNRSEAEAIAKEDTSLQLAPGVMKWMTPAFVCLLVVEGSDVMFSVDSVPAVIAVSKEPLIVYTAMIFAVLGLRSLYFIVEALTKYLCHLEKAVIGVLAFIGVKMLAGAAAHWGVKIPWWSDLPGTTQANYSLVVVLVALAVGVVASLLWPEKEGADEDEDDKAAGAE